MKERETPTPIPTTTEAHVQLACDRLMQKLGFFVVKFDQGYRPGGRRHGTTRQTKGIPDRLYLHEKKRLQLWREMKAPGKKLSPDQWGWHQTALRAGADVGVWDSLEAACADLSSYGWEVEAG